MLLPCNLSEKIKIMLLLLLLYYMIDDKGQSCIENVTSEKDIGVTFDNELKFNFHIQQKVKKAN